MDSSLIDDSHYVEKDYSWDEKEVDVFREKITEVNNMLCATDDMLLLSFLRARKFDLERSLELFKNYFSLRRRLEIFCNFTPSYEKSFLDTKYMGYMKKTDQDGRIIFICKSWDPSVFNVRQYLRCGLMYLDMLLTTHAAQVNGVVMIFNAEGYSASNLAQYTPVFLYEMVTSMFGSYQCRWKEIHILNTSGIIHNLMAMLMPLLPSKIKNRMFLHGTDMESLHKHVHPKYLPKEFGGEQPSFNEVVEISNEVLYTREQFFRKNERTWKTTEVTKL